MIQSSGTVLRRSFTMIAASTLVLASCGGGSAAEPPILRIYADAPLERVGSFDGGAGSFDDGGASEGLNSLGDGSMEGTTGSDMTMLANMRFELVAELPALDSSTAAYVIEQAEPSSDEVDMLMRIFGIESELEPQSAQMGGGFFAGSLDGSQPSLFITGDALHFWNYSPPASETTVDPACLETSDLEPVAPPTPVTDSVVVADTEAPPADEAVSDVEPEILCPDDGLPQDVPSEDEALSMFSDLMTDIGVDLDSLEIEVFSDSYGSSVTGFLMIGGVRSPLSWSVSYGEGSRIVWAGGVLAPVEKLADYDRIGTDAGLDRLNEQQASFVEQLTGSPEDLAAASGGSIGDEIVVPIVSVEEELIMLYGVDGSVYLVPGYAFLAEPDQFGYEPRYTVSALSDKYIETVEADQTVDDPSLGQQDPGLGSGMPGEDGSTGGEPGIEGPGGEDMQEITNEEANTLLGMSEQEATSTAEANGWVVRVAARDGEQFALTMDYNPKRVNLTVNNDVVSDVFIG
jgi:hypothetical protein